MTIGQLAFYDLVKKYLLGTGMFKDNTTTHFLSSLTAVGEYNIYLLISFIILV